MFSYHQTAPRRYYEHNSLIVGSSLSTAPVLNRPQCIFLQVAETWLTLQMQQQQPSPGLGSICLPPSTASGTAHPGISDSGRDPPHPMDPVVGVDPVEERHSLPAQLPIPLSAHHHQQRTWLAPAPRLGSSVSTMWRVQTPVMGLACPYRWICELWHLVLGSVSGLGYRSTAGSSLVHSGLSS